MSILTIFFKFNTQNHINTCLNSFFIIEMLKNEYIIVKYRNIFHTLLINDKFGKLCIKMDTKVNKS